VPRRVRVVKDIFHLTPNVTSSVPNKTKLSVNHIPTVPPRPSYAVQNPVIAGILNRHPSLDSIKETQQIHSVVAAPTGAPNDAISSFLDDYYNDVFGSVTTKQSE